ncbi:MAG: sigma 54-interacting transcriptional regulator [Burkholderiaceae bacterium]|nr:sigma 54-interacting transcriptional regulator [Burkholderiaceae bacterium]
MNPDTSPESTADTAGIARASVAAQPPSSNAVVRPGSWEASDTLAALVDTLAGHADLTSLLRSLAGVIGRVIEFDSVSVMLHDADKNVMRAYAHGAPLTATGRQGDEFALDDCPQGVVWRTQEPVMISDTRQDHRFSFVQDVCIEAGLCSYWVLPLTTARDKLGALAFGNRRPDAFRTCHPALLQRVARIVAVSVEAAENAARCLKLQERAEHERDRLGMLLDLTNTLVATRELDSVLRAASTTLRRLVDHDAAGLSLYDPTTGASQVVAFDERPNGEAIARFVDHPQAGSRFARMLETRVPFAREQLDAAEFPDDRTTAKVVALGFVSFCSVPIIDQDQVIGALSLGRRRREAFTADEIALIGQTGTQLALAIANARAHDEVRSLKDRLDEENRYLTEEIRSAIGFDEIVGSSAGLRHVLDQVAIVAPTDSTVLIEGETGTGKELIARAIHERSARSERALIKVNCAAIPEGLLESELFGHEKGSFTGAISQRKGKFELANGGTIFLDEIGDMPRDMQAKLLRALQEREIERVGASETIALDVRVIAATNVDLKKRVTDNEFRADLYYRLNVFPLRLPPLRERRGDIALLVNWFTQKLSRRMRKRIESVPARVMRALEAYAWPGNIRELENVIEHAVIVSHGDVLEVPNSALQGPATAPGGDETLESVEREHILRVLAECKWVLGGPDGAAARLGLKRTTLQSRMGRLGIARPV